LFLLSTMLNVDFTCFALKMSRLNTIVCSAIQIFNLSHREVQILIFNKFQNEAIFLVMD
jgi:hypothetical protein